MTTLFLLATKFYLPDPTQDLVSRPRLDRRLDAGLRGKLTLISAPAGFGKTTLAADWIRHTQAVPSGARKCWLSLDEGDNLPSRFWAYLITALQSADFRPGEAALTALQPVEGEARRSSIPIETVLVSLINDLAGLAVPLILVLDDYHLVTTPEIHAGLDFLIDHLPQNLHLVITTREDPPLSLSRLRVRGQLAEIRAADLQFQEAEAGEFLNQLLSLGLAAEDIRALAHRTEGWIAGLRLAALSLQFEDDKHGFIGAFTASHRFLTDYLVDEVLSRQEEGLRGFLCRTSILPCFSAGLCDSVLIINNSQAILRHLEQANLFLVPLDNERRWFRYHHLFAQFLRLHLQETEPERIPELNRRAMEWCASQGLEREALTYAFAIPDYASAACLIDLLAPGVLANEGPALVMQWIAALPRSLVLQRAGLCLQYAFALAFSGRFFEAEEHLAAAERLAGEMPTAEGDPIRGYVAAHRAHLLFFQGETAQTIHYARRALDLLPAHEVVIRARTAAILGSGLRYAGDFQGAEGILTQAVAAAVHSENIFIANLCFASLAELYTERGQLRHAMDIYHQALELTQRRAGRPDNPFAGFAYFGIGRIQREWDQLEPAEEYIQKGVSLCREWQQADMLVIGLMELSFLHQSLGDFDLARRDLEEAGEIVIDSPWGIAMVNAFMAQVDLASGDLAAASRWAQNCGVSILDDPQFERSADYHTLMWVLLKQEKYADCLTLAVKLTHTYRTVGRVNRLLIALICQALAYAGLGDQARAVETLQEALAAGDEGNYLRIFLEAGPQMVVLLRQLPAGPFRDRLLAYFTAEEKMTHKSEPVPAAPAVSAHREAASGEPVLVEALNERELTILRLMAAGLSNAAIGAELYLSVNTIRWYASQIYLKLGVTGRGEAVARARALEILP